MAAMAQEDEGDGDEPEGVGAEVGPGEDGASGADAVGEEGVQDADQAGEDDAVQHVLARPDVRAICSINVYEEASLDGCI